MPQFSTGMSLLILRDSRVESYLPCLNLDGKAYTPLFITPAEKVRTVADGRMNSRLLTASFWSVSTNGSRKTRSQKWPWYNIYNTSMYRNPPRPTHVATCARSSSRIISSMFTQKLIFGMPEAMATPSILGVCVKILLLRGRESKRRRNNRNRTCSSKGNSKGLDASKDVVTTFSRSQPASRGRSESNIYK